MKTTNQQAQLELGFNGAKSIAGHRRESPRMTRARWWFEQMRHVVDAAMDWEPNGPGRPEQTWFTEANGQSRN